MGECIRYREACFFLSLTCRHKPRMPAHVFLGVFGGSPGDAASSLSSSCPVRNQELLGAIAKEQSHCLCRVDATKTVACTQ